MWPTCKAKQYLTIEKNHIQVYRAGLISRGCIIESNISLQLHHLGYLICLGIFWEYIVRKITKD